MPCVSSLPIVLKTLTDKKTNPPGLKLPLLAIKKLLGLKDVPDPPYPDVKLPVSTDHLQIILLGIKEDEERVLLGTGTYQEAV